MTGSFPSTSILKTRGCPSGIGINSEPICQLLYFGDHWYAFNNDHDGMVIYYRRDLFTDPQWQAAFQEEYGYEFPLPPRTGRNSWM